MEHRYQRQESEEDGKIIIRIQIAKERNLPSHTKEKFRSVKRNGTFFSYKQSFILVITNIYYIMYE